MGCVQTRATLTCCGGWGYHSRTDSTANRVKFGRIYRPSAVAGSIHAGSNNSQRPLTAIKGISEGIFVGLSNSEQNRGRKAA
jgi:hypothetical protein